LPTDLNKKSTSIKSKPQRQWETPFLTAFHGPHWNALILTLESLRLHQLESHTLTPRAFVTKTCRSELVDALLSAHGDVAAPRFLKALDILSITYASSDPDKPSTEACIDNFGQDEFQHVQARASEMQYSTYLDMNEALTSVPWSLRREFAMAETDGRVKASTILRSNE
jgi:hypothetical protein